MAFRPPDTIPRSAVLDLFYGRGQGRTSMSEENGMSRRMMLVKLGILFNAIVGAVLAVPIVRFLFSPVTREKKFGYASWLSLGRLEQFPAGQTPLSTYRQPPGKFLGRG